MTDLPILLPPGYSPLVAPDDTVTVNQPLAEKIANPNEVTINIASELEVSVQKVGKTIRKNPGDKIQPGDVIAQKSGFLGMGEQKVVSSITGEISTYDRRTGDMTITLAGASNKPETESLLSPVAGKVLVCDNDKIVIQVEKEGMVPVGGIGGAIQAPLVVLSYDEPGALPLHFLTTDCIEKVIVTRALDKEGILKAVGIGVGGAIVEEFSDHDKEYLTDKGYSLPILQVTPDDYKTLSKLNGKVVYLDGDKKSILVLKKT